MSTAVFGAPGFKARSGRTVTQGEDGCVAFHLGNGYLGADVAMDAEEFFQAKRDAELERWRYPLNPDVVVYPIGETGAWVVNERTRDVGAYRRDGGGAARTGYEVAQAYFEANPVHKPWEDAKYGEVWEVTHTGDQVDLCRVNAWEKFEQVSGTDVLVSMPITHHSITAARKVWPEDAS